MKLEGLLNHCQVLLPLIHWQILKFERLTFYLDGAHTLESMQCCTKWFREAADKEKKKLGTDCARVLVFNITGQRKPDSMLEELQVSVM